MSEVHYICKTQFKEVTFTDVIKALESDFNERAIEDTSVSQEDLHFLTKLKEGIKHKADGHHEMPLPFKSKRRNLPNNMSSAMQRLNSLECRLRKDQKYYEHYVSFMEDIIVRGDAEKVLKGKLVTTLPGVYSPPRGIPSSKIKQDTCSV